MASSIGSFTHSPSSFFQPIEPATPKKIHLREENATPDSEAETPLVGSVEKKSRPDVDVLCPMRDD